MAVEDGTSTAHQTFTEVFKELFPIYLQMGMSYNQYWHGDVELARYYRKAYKRKQRDDLERENYLLWLNGLYIYGALNRIAPLFVPFANTQPEPYFNEPFPIFEKTKDEIIETQKGEMEKMRNYLEEFMRKQNSEDNNG